MAERMARKNMCSGEFKLISLLSFSSGMVLDSDWSSMPDVVGMARENMCRDEFILLWMIPSSSGMVDNADDWSSTSEDGLISNLILCLCLSSSGTGEVRHII